MPGDHALLSPSGAKKYMACTPSARFEEQFPESESEYAAEGSFAHSLAETIIRAYLFQITTAEYHNALEVAMKNPYYNQAMFDDCRAFAMWVRDVYQEMGGIILLEQKLDTSEWVPEGYGRGDVVIASFGTLRVTDFKYGKGVVVDVEDNEQLKSYALGAYSSFNCVFEFENVIVDIYQPRTGNISTAEFKIEDLLNWAETELKPKAELAWRGEGEFVAGDHCRFCRAKAVCQARADQTAIAAFADAPVEESIKIGPAIMTEEQLIWWYARADGIEKWLKSIKEYVLGEAEKGKPWTGFKLVEGRSNRVYSDVEAVAETLELAGCKDFYEPKTIYGITKMEALIGKKKFKELVEPLLIKPQGKPVLVPDTDSRPALNSAAKAAEAFKE